MKLTIHKTDYFTKLHKVVHYCFTNVSRKYCLHSTSFLGHRNCNMISIRLHIGAGVIRFYTHLKLKRAIILCVRQVLDYRLDNSSIKIELCVKGQSNNYVFDSRFLKAGSFQFGFDIGRT